MRYLVRSIVALSVAAVSSLAAAQSYVAVVLPNPSGLIWSVGNGASDGAFGGYSAPPGSNGLDDRAVIWMKGTPFDVTPAGARWAEIRNSRDGQHVGESDYRAFLWNSEGKPTNLHPDGYSFSEAIGVGGGRQVGIVGFSSMCSECGYFVERHAVTWTGSAGSYRLLHSRLYDEPRPTDTDGSTIVGAGQSLATYDYHALLWTNLDTIVDLHPVGFTRSFAQGVDGLQQVGWGEPPYPQDYAHALLWTGSAQSVIDLNPAGYLLTVAYSVRRGTQVGGGRTIEPGPDRALAWHGSAGSVVDLHRLLPNGFRLRSSIANDVDAAGNIVGVCTEDATGYPRAVAWYRVLVSN